MKIGKHQTVLLGPPGTGKTTTLMKMVEDALLSGIKPEEIALVSFTKKAVTEAADRACSRFKLTRKRLPLFQTVHSLCFSRLGCSKGDLMTKQNYQELGAWLGYEFTSSTDMEDGILTSGIANGDKLLFLDNIARVKCQTVREVWEEEGFDVSWPELERFSAGYAKYNPPFRGHCLTRHNNRVWLATYTRNLPPPLRASCRFVPLPCLTSLALRLGTTVLRRQS